MDEQMHINANLSQAFEVLKRNERFAPEHGGCVFGNE
jgi:hypothetical protein